MALSSFKLTHLNVIASDGAYLPALWYRSAATQNKAVVVYTHGAGSASIIRNPERLNTIAETLTTNNIDFLAFNNRGSGYITKFDMADGTSILGGMTYEKIGDFQLDIEGVFAWAKSEGYTDIYIAGHSTGANKIVLAEEWATEHPEIKGLILISGGDDITLQRQVFADRADTMLAVAKRRIADGAGRELASPADLPWNHPISWASLAELLEEGSDYDVFPFGRADIYADAFNKVSRITTPTTAIYGTADFGTVVSADEAVKILKAANPALRTVLVEGADHGYHGMDTQLANAIYQAVKSK